MAVAPFSCSKAFSSLCWSLPVMITLLPLAENDLAISRPMPALPPLINTVLLLVFIS
jgi:hypothetical protein